MKPAAMAVLVLVLCTMPLRSQAATPDPSESYAMLEEFRLLDLNRDGLVSQAEAAGNAEIVTKFQRADRNRDGQLSFSEFKRLKAMKSRTASRDAKPAASGATARRRPAKTAD
jgi:hypothetical protein